jgi:SpoVK/Ycf46/Vps4 family AAA+-type ATPase
MLHQENRGVQRFLAFSLGVIVAIIWFALAGPQVRAQGVHPLAQRLADQRIEFERIGALSNLKQISSTEYQARRKQWNSDVAAVRARIAKLPRDQQAQIMQQAESLFQTQIVPLREQWKQQLLEQRQEAQAQDARIRSELTADADKAGQFQAARTLLLEKLQRNELSQADFAKNDKIAEQEVLALQRKYDAYGLNWGRLFSQTVARVAQKVTADTRLKNKLADSSSELGRDAHRAAELTLSIQRNQVFRSRQAITPQQEQAMNSPLQAELAQLDNKYRSTPPAFADFRDRVSRLVQAGITEQSAQWSRDADAARLAANTRHTAPPYNAGATPSRPISPPTASPTPMRPNPVPNAGLEGPPPVPPRSFPQPSLLQRGNWQSAGVLMLMLIPLTGGIGYLWYRRRRSAAPPRYTDAKHLPAPKPQQAADLPLHQSTPQQDKPLPPDERLGLKERLFAQQREKYQQQYNSVLDEMTNASLELGRLTSAAEGVQNNLLLLSNAVQARVLALLEARYASIGRLLLNAAIFMPIYRLFKRAGILFKLVIIVAAAAIVLRGAALIAAGNIASVAIPYILLLTLFFFVEKRIQLKTPLNALQKSADSLKRMSLAYVYDDQIAHIKNGAPAYHAIRVSAAVTNPPAEEFEPSGQLAAPGAFFVGMGSMATYRVERNGSYTLAATDVNNEFMKSYGPLLTEAFAEQNTFAVNSLDPLAEYGQAAWRKRRASEQLPQLEKLVKDVERLETVWRDTCVSDKVFEFVLRRIDLFNMRDSATPAGLLLYGYQGNGKVHLARKIAESVSARLEQVTPAMLGSANDVKALWEKNRGKEPVVLLVADAERVFPRPRSENEGAGTREATLAWLTEWAKHEPRQSLTWVVMTAESEQELHPATLAQFGGSKIEVGAPDANGRGLVLRNACKDNQLAGEPPDWLIGDTGGASIRELRDIVKETKLQCVPNPPQESHWREAVKSVRGSDAAFKDESKTWDRLVLPADTKEQLQRACRILREADRYKEKGVNVPNILLFGPPGTGKTDIARTFANEGGVKFLMATTADLKAQYVGQSAHLVRGIFSKARASAPAVLFIDEIETVAAKRGSSLADSFTQDVVTEMLAQMDGARKYDRPVFVLAATNLPEQIDPAILSRFTSKIEIALPDEASRSEMLKRLIGERAVDPALDIEGISSVLAKRLDRKSGRDLVMLVNRAMERAVLVAASPDDVRLTRELLLAEVSPQGREVSDADLQKVWSQIVLKQEVKESILSKIRMFNRGDKAAPRGMLLYGPPGTGKTEIARRIADSTSSYFMSLTGSDLKKGYVGQSGESVKKIWEQARSRGRCVIFIDECDAVFARRGSVSTDAGTEELVPEFLASWDGMASEGQVWVVGATNKRERLDEAIVSRFGAAVEIGLPEPPERLEILKLEMRKLERDADIPEFVASATTGFAGRDLSQMARDVCTMAAERRGAITPEMWKEVIARYAKASSESVEESARWNALVLSEETIDKLKTVCESLRQIELLQKQGIQPPRGALLYGPPGTGKTQIARTLANESGLPFIAAGPADIKAGFLGQSGLKVHELFERARGKAPCILFIDEIDAGAARRGSGKADQYTDEIVTQMLTELDGVKKHDRHVFLLAATNHPELVDEAILSRFVDKIEIPNPDVHQRRRLFQIQLTKKRVDFEVDLVSEELACGSGEISGRDIYSLVERASQQALHRALKTGRADQVILSRQDLIGQLPRHPSRGA